MTLIDNYVIEIQEGFGMVVDGSTCYIELNQLKKNAYGGMLITSTGMNARSQVELPSRNANLEN